MSSSELMEPPIESEEKKPEKQPRSVEELRFRNELQMKLIRRYAEERGMDKDEAAMEWAGGKYSKAFSDALDKIKEKQPELIVEYTENPEILLQEIESLLY